MKFIRKLYFFLLYLLPVILFFSYYPLIKLGSNATMNFELSLPLIFLVLFDAIAFLSLIWYGRLMASSKKLFATNEERAKRGAPVTTGDDEAGFVKKSLADDYQISDRKFFLFALFPSYATLSIFWSANPTRAVLTAGVLWLTFFAAFAIIYITPLLNPAKSLRRILVCSFFISTALVCVFCWIQCFLDITGISRDITLLCPGCTYRTFGFPHPSGFAIEPQFMGNLLLAPTLLSLYFLTMRKNGDVLANNQSSKRPFATNGERGECSSARNDGPEQTYRVKIDYLLVICSFLFSSTLFLTFSRGAIYAFAVALFILFIFALVRRHFRPSLILIPIAAFAFTLTAQGIFSVISPVHDSFSAGVAKSIHQLSLGLIDLRFTAITPEQDNPTPVENPVENSQPSTDSGSISSQDPAPTSQFDGYIPESTNTRLGLNSVALQTWLSSPYYIFFGVGLGGAGIAMSEHFPGNPYAVPDAIVQNEPISLLLELGLVGIALIMLAFALVFIPGRYLKFLHLAPAETTPSAPSFWQLPALPFLLSLIIAYLITLNFFSGLPNALHIYLLPPLFYYLFKKVL